jgi:hypothetical protein
MTHPQAGAKLSASKRLLRAAGHNGDRDIATALHLLIAGFEFERLDDGELLGSFVLRKMGVTLPTRKIEQEQYRRNAVSALAVALLDGKSESLFRARARDIFYALSEYPQQWPQTRSTSGFSRSRTTPPPVETTLTDEECAAVVFAPSYLVPEGERTAFARKLRGERITSNAEKLALYRARKRIIHLKESGLMDDVVTLHRRRLEQADENSQRLHMIEKYLGLDAVEQAESFLAERHSTDLSEEDIRDLMGD